MVRAKHKINKITIQVIFLQDYHEAERSDFFFISFSRWRLNSRLRKPIALNANLCCD